MQHRTLPEPPLTVVESLVSHLSGIHPALDKVVAGLAELATLQASPAATGTILAALAGNCDNRDVLDLLGRVIAHLGDPASNAGLRAIPAERGQRVRSVTAEWWSYMADCSPRELIYEASWDTDPVTLPVTAGRGAPMPAADALRIAEILVADGLTNPDAITHADMDAAADLAGIDRADSDIERYAIRAAITAVTTSCEGEAR